MSTPAVAAGAAALGFYVWLKQWQQCGYASLEELPILPETHARTEAPPTTWTETFYLFKEALRYTYQETFARWHAVDLFFGLAYISRRATSSYPAADIAAAGQPISKQQLSVPQAQQLLSELQQVRRFMLYCQGLRHHRPEQQRKHWHDHVGLGDADIMKHNPTAGLLRPAYVVLKDRAMGSIILCIRGTHSRSDMFTSLTGAVKPHHVVTSDGVVLGYSHLGMLAAARWLMASTKSTLITALQQNPDYDLKIVGHSMGAGTAAHLTMMLRDKVPELATATAWAIACPACMTLQLARSCAPFVTTLIHGTDIVPTFSSGAIDKLRQEVTQSSWFADFQRDIRQRLTANFTNSMRGLRQGASGTAQWTHRNIIRTAATSISSCYTRAPRSCYHRAPRQKAAETPVLPAPSAAAAAAPAATAETGVASSSRLHAPSRFSRRLPGRAKASSGGVVHVSTMADARNSADADAALPLVSSTATMEVSSGAAAAAGRQLLSDTGAQSHGHQGTAGHWLSRMMGFGRVQHKGGAAGAAAPGAGDRLLADSGDADTVGPHVNNGVVSEAMLVERTLEACLSAVDTGKLSPSYSNEGKQTTAVASADNSRAILTAGAAHPSGLGLGSNNSSSRTAAAGNILKGVSRAILGKRPAAPSKKDDDVPTSPRAEAAEPAAAAAAGDAGASHLPVSTAAADPAAATSSGSKPLPLSLRRRGWGWSAMFGAPGHGWVTDEPSGSSSSTAAGHSVVQYIGQTVGHTGKAVLQTTGQLLRGGSMFQNCAAPMATAAAAAAAAQQGTAAAGSNAARLPPRPASKQRRKKRQQQQRQLDAGASSSSSIMVAPGSSSNFMTMHRDGMGSLTQQSLAAAAGLEADSWQQHAPYGSSSSSSDNDDYDDVSADETLDGDSSSDPDLIDDQARSSDADDGLMAALNIPAMQASISALMAAAGDDLEREDMYSQAHREEAAAAERLLKENNESSPALINMGLANKANHSPSHHQQQQQQQQQQAAASYADMHADTLEVGQQQEAAIGDEESLLTEEQQQQHYDEAAATADHMAQKAAERRARRQMFPAGRILHLMPASVVATVQAAQQSVDADHDMPAVESVSRASVECESAAGLMGDSTVQQLSAGQVPSGGLGVLGDEYVLLEVDNVEVYGRMRLCPAMVRDHFIPSYLRALDSVIGQLQQQLP